RQVAPSLTVLDQRMLTGSPAGTVVRVISTLIWGDARVTLHAAKPVPGTRFVASRMMGHASANLNMIAAPLDNEASRHEGDDKIGCFKAARPITLDLRIWPEPLASEVAELARAPSTQSSDTPRAPGQAAALNAWNSRRLGWAGQTLCRQVVMRPDGKRGLSRPRF